MDPSPHSPPPRTKPSAPFDHLAYERATREASGAGAGNPLVLAAIVAVGTFGVALALLFVTGRFSSPSGGANAATVAFAAPLCDGVGEGDRAVLSRSFELMRLTAEGMRLADQIVRHDICVSVEAIDYAGGYARSRQTIFGDWSGTEFVIAKMMIEYGDYDTIAATLIHEATHIDRAIRDSACSRCETLANGINLDEEVTAHAAVAEWWIARYGTDGRQAWTGFSWYSHDNLAFAYQRGPDAFRDHVRSIREGQRLS